MVANAQTLCHFAATVPTCKSEGPANKPSTTPLLYIWRTAGCTQHGTALLGHDVLGLTPLARGSLTTLPLRRHGLCRHRRSGGGELRRHQCLRFPPPSLPGRSVPPSLSPRAFCAPAPLLGVLPPLPTSVSSFAAKSPHCLVLMILLQGELSHLDAELSRDIKSQLFHQLSPGMQVVFPALPACNSAPFLLLRCPTSPPFLPP